MKKKSTPFRGGSREYPLKREGGAAGEGKGKGKRRKRKSREKADAEWMQKTGDQQQQTKLNQLWIPPMAMFMGTGGLKVIVTEGF